MNKVLSKNMAHLRPVSQTIKVLREIKLPSGETVEIKDGAYVYRISLHEIAPKKPQSLTKEQNIKPFRKWLADCDKVAKSIKGKFDSVADIREIRDERMKNL